MNTLKIILASASPRRRQFLTALGIPHATAAADIDETPHPGERAETLALRLARSKAQRVADSLPADQRPALVIGADTVVALDGALLGKPADAAEAVEMLVVLRGRVHQVYSALAVVYVNQAKDLSRRDAEAQGREATIVNTTRVTMRNYTDAEIAAYVATGDPLDKAGAYAIQHRGFDPVARLDGCPSGVMGLPAADLLALLAEFGIAAGCPVAPVCRSLTSIACCQIDSPSRG